MSEIRTNRRISASVESTSPSASLASVRQRGLCAARVVRQRVHPDEILFIYVNRGRMQETSSLRAPRCIGTPPSNCSLYTVILRGSHLLRAFSHSCLFFFLFCFFCFFVLFCFFFSS